MATSYASANNDKLLTVVSVSSLNLKFHSLSGDPNHAEKQTVLLKGGRLSDHMPVSVRSGLKLTMSS